jgi:penicillin amidase
VRYPGLRSLGVAAGTLSALSAGAFGYLLHRLLPQVEGELRVRGLNGPVEVIRDRWGIPHISARDEWDAYFAQGLCHAQDRLWQMELNRRLSRGQLSEVMGTDALDLDRFMRRLGLHRAAQAEWEAAGPEVRSVLEAYAAGVNACIEELQRSGKLPVEFMLTRLQPRRWEPLDSLTFGRFFAFNQSPNWENELIRSRLIARLGYAAASLLEPDVWQPNTDALTRLSDWGPAEMPDAGDLPPVWLPGAPAASNGWVVSGERSATRKPLLGYDPHFFYTRLPSIVYEAHLVGGGDLNVIGGTIPGVPGVAFGHNRHIAWGFTVSKADMQDLFVERVDPGDPRRTEFAGRWETGTLVRETIRVKGRTQPWIEDVLVTSRHGPLLTPTPALADEHRPLALKSMVLETVDLVSPLLALNHARNWEEFRAALSQMGVPPVDTLYADVDGNIGHQVAGRVPIRARGEGLVPAPGWSGQYEWLDVVPFDELPSAFNPSDGLWATANHNLGKNSRHFFSREYDSPARYRRIRQVLESKAHHSAVDFGALQADQVSLPAREIARILTQRLHPTGELQARALDELRGWDGRVGADSAAAAICHVFAHELLRRRHQEALGNLLPAVLGVGPHPALGPITSFYFLQTERVLAYLTEWANGQDGTGGAGSAHPDHAHAAFSATVRYLREQRGPDVAEWQWGRLHTLKLEHPLSMRKPLGLFLDVPAFRWGGDLETVRMGGPLPGKVEGTGMISGYRFIADCADWDGSLSCIPGGQSGHRGSPHYADQVDEWRRVAYHSQPFTRPAILRHARHTLHLVPG